MSFGESKKSHSADLFARAQKVLPGGVSRNTVFRLPHPIYAERGNGCFVTDVESNEYIDFSNNMASLIHGHAHSAIVEEVTQQLQRGSAFATATEAEIRFAEHLCSRSDSFEKIRFVNSGTEAVMTAVKAARAHTGRPMIAKAEGAYHGGYDYAEVSQTAKPANWGESNSPASVPVAQGTPPGALRDVVVLPFNNVEQSIRLLDEHADQIACVLIDPLPHRIGFIWASDDFIDAIYEWTRKNGALLVFDEVITFRCQYGGAQERFRISPDLTALGKMIGGGFPIGAVAGRTDVMSVLDPTRPDLPFPHSGTFSANPISTTAGRVAMELFDKESVLSLNQLGDYARKHIAEVIESVGVPACVTGDGSFFRIHLKPNPPRDFRTCYAPPSEAQTLKRLVDHLYERGMIMINTCSGTLSTPMKETEIDRLAEAVRTGLIEIKSELQDD